MSYRAGLKVLIGVCLFLLLIELCLWVYVFWSLDNTVNNDAYIRILQ